MTILLSKKSKKSKEKKVSKKRVTRTNKIKKSKKSRKSRKNKKSKPTRKNIGKPKKRVGAGVKSYLSANLKNLQNIGKRMTSKGDYLKDTISLEEVRDQILILEEEMSSDTVSMDGINIVMNAYKKKVDTCPPTSLFNKDPDESWKLLDCHTTKTVFYHRCVQYLSDNISSVIDSSSVEDKKDIESNIKAMVYHFKSRRKSHGQSTVDMYFRFLRPEFMKKHNQNYTPRPTAMRLIDSKEGYTDFIGQRLDPLERIVPVKDDNGNNTGQWIVIRTDLALGVGGMVRQKKFIPDRTSTNKLSKMVDYVYDNTYRGSRPNFNPNEDANIYNARYVHKTTRVEEEGRDEFGYYPMSTEKEVSAAAQEAIPVTEELKEENIKRIEEKIEYLKEQKKELYALRQQYMKNEKNKASVEQEKKSIEEILEDMANKGFPVEMYIKRRKRVQGQYVNVIELRHFDADIDSYLNDFRQELKAFTQDTIQVPVAVEAYPLEAMSRSMREDEAYDNTIEAYDVNPNAYVKDVAASMRSLK